MWILWNILVGIMIAGVITIIKKYGGNPVGDYFMYLIGAAATFAWALPYAYRLSPNFIYPYMIQNASLNISGPVLALIVFHDIISINGWLGIILITIGSYMLIK